MPYRAQRPSLFGHVGGPRDTSAGQVDYGSAIDALTNGASSLIRNVYLMRQQQAQLAREAEDRTYQRSRDTVQDRLAREEFDHRRRTDNAKLLSEGYHEGAHVPTGAIARAMSTAPGAQVAGPPDAEVQTPGANAHFDLDRNINYRTSTDRARITAEAAADQAQRTASERARLQAERLSAQRSNIEFLARARQMEAERAHRRKTDGGPVRRALTANEQNQLNLSIAAGLLQMNGGRVNEVIEDFRAAPADQRPEGLTEDHIIAAYGQYMKGAVGSVTGMISGLDMGVGEATATRDSVVRALQPPRLAPPRTGTAPGATAGPPAANAPAGGAPPRRSAQEAAAGAAKLIRERKATIEQALASRSLSDSAKAILRRQFGDSTTKK